MGIEEFQSSQVVYASGVANSGGASQNGEETVSSEIEWLVIQIERQIKIFPFLKSYAERK
jgi:hypothetical protein